MTGATKPPHAGKGDRLVCDCWSGADHVEGCVLGQAETIAGEALGTAAADTHPLVASLVALTEAGMLSPVIADEETIHGILMGLLDDLYEANLLADPPPRADEDEEEPVEFVHPDLGPMPGYVVGRCGHRVARSEWNAGLRNCERDETAR